MLIAGAAAVSMAVAGAVFYAMTRPGGGGDQGARGEPDVAQAGVERPGSRPSDPPVPAGGGGAGGPQLRRAGPHGASSPGAGVPVAVANPIDVTRPAQLQGPGRDRPVNLRFSPDGRKLAVFTQKGEVHLWDLEARESMALAEANGRDNSNPATRLAFTADGKTLLAGNAFQVTAWDTSSGQTLHQYGTLPPGVMTTGGEVEGVIAVSPDASSLVTLDYPGDGTSRYQVWDTATTKERFAFDWPNMGRASAVAFSPDGKTLAATAHDAKLTRMWDVPAGNELDPLREGYSAIVLADGPRRLLGWQTNVYHEWAIGGGPPRLQDRREVPLDTVPSFGFPTTLTPDGRTVVYADMHHVRLWDVAARAQRAVVPGGQHPFAITPDGSAVMALASLTASAEKLTAVEIGTDTGELRLQHEFGVPREPVRPAEPVALSADGRVLAVGARDGTVHFRPLVGHGSTAPRLLATLAAAAPKDVRYENRTIRRREAPGPYDPVRLRFSADDRFLVGRTAVGSDDWNVVWDVAAGQQRADLEAPGIRLYENPDNLRQQYIPPRQVSNPRSKFHSWTIVPGSKTLWATVDNLHQVTQQATMRERGRGADAGPSVSLESVDEHGQRLVEFDLSAEAPAWPAVDGHGYHVLQLPRDGKIPDGKIAAGPARLQSFRDPWEPLLLEASPDGATVAGAVRMRRDIQERPPYRLVLLDPRTLQEQAALAEFTERGGPEPRLAFSRDGRLLAATFPKLGSTAVRVWEVGARKELPTAADTDGFLAFADGRTLVTGGPQTVVLYDVDNGQRVAEVDLKRGHPSAVSAFAVSPTAPLLASGGMEGEVLIRDLRSGDVLVRFNGHPAKISGLAFSSDGKRLAAVSAAQMTAKLWEVPADLKPLAPVGVATAQVVRLTPRAVLATGPAPGARRGGGPAPGSDANSLGMTFATIPAGQFDMGAADLDTEAQPNEKPAHAVRITRPFAMSVHEVTVGQFRAFIAAAGYQPECEKYGGTGYDAEKKEFDRGSRPEFTWKNPGWEQGDDHPVVNVSRNDAKAFCAWLSQKEGKSYRLPTEAQWEYAARAGSRTRYWTGDAPTTLRGAENLADTSLKSRWAAAKDWAAGWDDGLAFTSPVGRFRPNPWGLYDMLGNVSEWTGDWYSDEYYRDSPEEDPTGPASGDRAINRGGSWSASPTDARPTARWGFHSREGCDASTGFRVVRVP